MDTFILCCFYSFSSFLPRLERLRRIHNQRVYYYFEHPAWVTARVREARVERHKAFFFCRFRWLLRAAKSQFVCYTEKICTRHVNAAAAALYKGWENIRFFDSWSSLNLLIVWHRHSTVFASQCVVGFLLQSNDIDVFIPFSMRLFHWFETKATSLSPYVCTFVVVVVFSILAKKENFISRIYIRFCHISNFGIHRVREWKAVWNTLYILPQFIVIVSLFLRYSSAIWLPMSMCVCDLWRRCGFHQNPSICHLIWNVQQLKAKVQ